MAGKYNLQGSGKTPGPPVCGHTLGAQGVPYSRLGSAFPLGGLPAAWGKQGTV